MVVVHMVAKVLKEIDYLQLVLLIYKLSQLKQDHITILYNYTCNYFNDRNISKEYLLKLQCDLQIKNPPKLQYKSLEKQLGTVLTPQETALFKVELFNTVQKCYYS